MESEADIDDLAAIVLDVNQLDASRDPRFYLGIMCFLGSIALVSLVGSIVMLIWCEELEPSIIAVGSAAVGALAAALTKSLGDST